MNRALPDPPSFYIINIVLGSDINVPTALFLFASQTNASKVTGANYSISVSLNAVTGILTTIINVCVSQGVDWSVLAIVITVVTGMTLLVSTSSTCLEKVKQEDAVVRYTS